MSKMVHVTQKNPLTREQIDQIFAEAEKQWDYIVALYKLALEPAVMWDDIVKVYGYPVVSDATNKYIFEKAIAFDAKHHPKVLSGGGWMNNGFGTEPMSDWTVTYDGAMEVKGEG